MARYRIESDPATGRAWLRRGRAARTSVRPLSFRTTLERDLRARAGALLASLWSAARSDLERIREEAIGLAAAMFVVPFGLLAIAVRLFVAHKFPDQMAFTVFPFVAIGLLFVSVVVAVVSRRRHA